MRYFPAYFIKPAIYKQLLLQASILLKAESDIF